MPGEQPGVEYKTINTAALFEVVFNKLFEGDFVTTLIESAQQRLAMNLVELAGRSLDDTGSFIFQLKVADGADEEINPSIPDWFAVQYGYEIDDDGDICIGPENLFQSYGKLGDDTPPNANGLDIYLFRWQEINWASGYGLLFDTEPLSGRDLN